MKFSPWLIIFFCIHLGGCDKPKDFKELGLVHSGFKYTEKQTVEGRFTKSEYLNTKEDLELTIVGPEQLSPPAAEERIKTKVFMVRQLFRDVTPPYKGKITTLNVCDKTYAPQESRREGAQGIRKIMVLFANERKALGVCLEKEIKYQVSYTFIYCPEAGNYYELKLYSKSRSRKELAILSEGFHCES